MKPQKVTLIMLSTLIVLSVANMGLGIMHTKVLTAPSLPVVENVPVSPEIKDDFIGPEGARVELMKKMPDDYYGDVYYVYPDYDGEEERLLIAQSLTLENGAVTNSFDSVFYNDAILSPNGRWVALPAACWEETCLRLYDVKAQSLRWVDHAAMEAWWLPDGRLRTEGKCAMPRVVECGPFESISPDEPWKM